jgi:hypothetical protein
MGQSRVTSGGPIQRHFSPSCFAGMSVSGRIEPELGISSLVFMMVNVGTLVECTYSYEALAS